METFNQIILYFFSPLPGREFLYYIPLVVLVIALLAASIYIPWYSRKNKNNKAYKKVFKSYPAKLQLMSFLLALYVLFRYYYVPVFSMRFLLYVLIAITAYLLYAMVKAYKKSYPQEKERRTSRAEMNEYMPKKRKKKK